MKYVQNLSVVALAVVLGALAPCAQAVSLPVLNPSFEADVLPNDLDFTLTAANWTGASQREGAINESEASFPGALDGGTPIGADGTNVGWISGNSTGNNGIMTQGIVSSVQLGHTYTLTVAIGYRFGRQALDDWWIGLYEPAFASQFTERVGLDTELTQGEFLDFSTSFTAGAGDVGKQLMVYLGAANVPSGNGVTYFDNIRLTNVAGPIPEPEPEPPVLLWWDQFPRIYQGNSASDATRYHASISFNGGQKDPTWGTFLQTANSRPSQIVAAHAAGLKSISYYETFGQSYSTVAELGPWDEVNLTPVLAYHWNWQDYAGGTIRWLGVNNFFDDEDFARPYTRTHPIYGGSPMTYPDGTIATGYNGPSTDPRNSRVYDAGSAKNILGGLSLDYEFNNTGQTAGLLYIPGQNKYASLVYFKKDSAAPAWNSYTYASTRMAADAGMDGMWSDNFGPWDSFGNPPVQHAFGDWSVARFRNHLSTNFTPSQLTSMGVSDVSTFDIRTKLRSIMQGYGGNSSDLGSPTWRDSRWLNEPLWRAYAIYKRQVGTEALTNYYNLAHQAAADAGVSDFMVAGNDIPGFSLGWARGSLDLVSTEWSAGWGLSTGPSGVGLPPIGRSAPAYKLAREHAKSRFVNVWLYKDGFETALSQPNTSTVLYYEMLANHTLPMFAPGNPRVAGTPTANIAFNDFVSQVEPEFGARAAVEDIGIYYSSSSLLSNFTPGGYLNHASQPHQFGYYGWGTALGELHYQYKAVPEWKLDAQALDDLRVLIIPESDVFDSTDVFNVLTPWVQGGGRLIVTGASGQRLGEEGNFDVNAGGYTLASLTGVTNIASAPVELLQNIGAGKVLYLRDNIGMDFFNANVSRPSLLSQFSNAMNNVLAGSALLVLSADTVPSSVGLAVYEDSAAGRLFVDVNNFDINVATDQITDTGSLTFEVVLPAWMQDKEIKLSTFSPELVPTASFQLLSSDRIEITLDSVRYYSSVMIENIIDNADFDGDGDIDGTDFLIWQRGFGTGTTLAEGDANNSGTVDALDLVVLEDQYGTTSPLSSTSAAVPEPTSLVLISLGGMLILSLSRKTLTPSPNLGPCGMRDF